MTEACLSFRCRVVLATRQSLLSEWPAVRAVAPLPAAGLVGAQELKVALVPPGGLTIFILRGRFISIPFSRYLPNTLSTEMGGNITTWSLSRKK